MFLFYTIGRCAEQGGPGFPHTFQALLMILITIYRLLKAVLFQEVVRGVVVFEKGVKKRRSGDELASSVLMADNKCIWEGEGGPGGVQMAKFR